MGFNLWLNSVAEAGSKLLRRREREPEKSLKQLCSELYSRKGEALGTALARQVVERYQQMTLEQKREFFQLLLEQYSVNADRVIESAERFRLNRDSASLSDLSRALEAPRQHLFRRINMAPEGTSTLVAMRRDLLGLLKEDASFKPVNEDLKHLLSSWFNRGFLSLQAIDWKTPALILEKLIAYEAVHEMDGWDDLRRRLASDRRCFAFFHPALPEEPLIFVEVALVNGLADNVQTLLEAPERPLDDQVDTAIFYSISNCQEGLTGISFGNFLIKQVVMELQAELPQLKQFATLSPIPGFRTWLRAQLGEDSSPLINADDRALIEALNDPQWYLQQSSEMQSLLMRLCAQYLCLAKRAEQPRDPVARFHLGNGARLERLNWQGDLSENGLAQSYGILVNYQYDLPTVEKNHEEFVNQGTVAASDVVTRLCEGRRPRQRSTG
ncbi:malonyl-CoA decarboxylase [Pseudomaricurvus alkylphenolicus]|jgi:malonyl-CoA decarboxylase|uniref:malonyl-CoA decarboxylase n=1 Tax=Pseudomaricurvus alkylphenolicus TaxID=1306991 RepID=UPI00142251CC|nr:malonyl-CoA decarboxylase [Pseudomaricurvus alkylphenolicus]NIB41688.1 malonyl-CoA decarboxylase [Pseudomaricurvus alkylphenolicus]